MFIVTEMNTTVIVNPRFFLDNISEICKQELNRKLSNTVLHNVGLCLYCREVVEFGDSILKPNDGSTYTNVTFRFVVFRPEISSIIMGKIKSCTSNGLYVSLGFFDDVFIPHTKMQFPSKFNEIEKAWVWEYSTGDEEETHELFLDEGDTIRFRVVDEQFLEHEPEGPPGSEEAQRNIKPSYIIVGAINESGLGVESWWN